MIKRIVTIASTILLGSVTGTAAMAEPDAGAFVGKWKVAGVAVSNTGVQALADNDPSLMGKQLIFSTSKLTWEPSSATGDACVDPQFARLDTPVPEELKPQLRKLGFPRPTPFSLHCRSGTWGPDSNMVIFRGAGGALAMPWYDGGVLKLVRQ